MQTIVVNSQKGGSGKSTLCRVLSVEASRAGLSVYLIDFDRDGHTLTNWHQTREAEEPRRVELSIAGLGEGLKLLEHQRADLVLIDTPPNSIQDMAEIFPLADLVLVPIKPTPDDLQAAAVTVAKLKALRLPFLFVITQAIAALSHHGPVAETLLVNRVVYPAAFTDGRTPQEVDLKGQAAREVGKLWLNIKTCLHANMTDERKAANG